MTAHAATSPSRPPRSPSPTLPALTPLVMAILAAFPLHAAAQASVLRPVVPPAFVVPRPMPGWRVFGVGAAAPLNRPNAAGGTDQTIDQTSLRAIYNWQSFDIGSSSSVTFNFTSKDSSALNRVVGSPSPSQIFGVLRSRYANPDGTQPPLVGGTVYLINANGILFGRDAQVNVGSLIASTLNVKDADFLSGLSKSIASQDPSFAYEGAPELFTDEHNFVVVDPGATITTASGGRVFLFAKNVQNAGTIRTPGGQTVLAGGSEVYLNDPTAERLYASEVNPDYPALRGLLVEVGQGNGSASNLAGGVIDTARGNTTLVGMAVNQSGRISATTSVSENGSVMLLARGNAVTGTERGTIVKRATTGGRLTLGEGSLVDIAPDTTPGSDGKLPTSDGNTTFTKSRVELAGQTIELQDGASIVAHGGVVDARAESKPFYQANTSSSDPHDWAAYGADDAARLVLGANANIDVSGTTSTTVSVARNFVTTDLIGKTDLKDAPLQKDGPIYRSRVTFDVRSASPILGDTSSYQNGIQRSADEWLSAGGTVSLSSTGAVVTHQSSNLNVSGGQVSYTAAMVNPTRLVAADGTRYTLDQAPKDIVYTSIENASGAASYDRWGVVPNFTPSQARSGHLESGYVAGQAGGVLSILAPVSVLDGHVQASTVNGVRQTGGQDARATTGRIELGTRSNGAIAFGDASFLSAGLQDLVIAKDTASLDDTFWTQPLGASLPASSRIAASTIQQSGAGQLVITSDGSITQEAGAGITLGRQGVLDLAAAGANGIDLGGGFRSAGGTFKAQTGDLSALANHGATTSGAIVLQAGQVIDVAGEWVNRALDGATAAAATSGGSATFNAAHGLNLQDASRIDVSGGATVGTAGGVQGTDAGSITLQSNLSLQDGSVPAAIHVGSVLKGQSLTGGGTLRLRADDVSIGGRPIPRGVQDGRTIGSLNLSEAFFRNGAFTSYDVTALHSLDVQAGTLLAPRASNWVLDAGARNVASGTRPSSVLVEGQLPDAQRKAVNLSLTAAAPFASPTGELTIASGARIVADPLASINLTAARTLDDEGRIGTMGGNVSLSLSGGKDITPTTGVLRLGSQAVIDVSGGAVLQPQTGLLPQGQVLAGGGVTISVASASTRTTPIELLAGSVIDADGASARLGVATTSAGGHTVVREQTVGSAGGSISIRAQEGGATLNGSMHAVGGAAGVAGGNFSLTLGGVRDLEASPPINLIDDYTIVVQQARVTQAEAVPGSVLLSAQSLREGFADLNLQSLDRIRFAGDVDLSMARNLRLDAAVISASPDARSVNLSGGSTLQVGGTPATAAVPFTAVAGTTDLTLQGGLVELFGTQAMQGFAEVGVRAASEVRLQGVANDNKALVGKLSLQADLTLSAPQVVPTSNSRFTIDAPGHRVLVTGGDASAAVPLSAGAAVTVDAREITTIDPAHPDQYGVLRAPQGSLTLNATDSVRIGSGSVLSVAGAAIDVPFGATSGGANWTYLGQPVDAPPAKTINLQAPGQRVDVSAGATLDLSGGSDLLALEFVAGPGGSRDVFAGAAGGAFAVVPTVNGYAPQDADILALKDGTGAQAAFTLGRQITFGVGGPLPAGTYAVLPARYAVLPGAFLVRPVNASAPLELGAAIARPDGSVLVGGRFGDAGTGFADPVARSFQVSGSALAQTTSEIRQTAASDYFSARAARAETPVPALPIDAGRLNISADQLDLKGTTLFRVAADPRSRGGELDISAGEIRVGSTPDTTSGVLSLEAADLNATGASLIVLGGTRGADGRSVQVAATNVVVDNAGTALKVNDLVLVARHSVDLHDGAAIEAQGSQAAPALAVDGDGALLRVSADASATSVRTGATRAQGDLTIGAGVTLAGGAITAEATRRNTIADSARLSARSITLGASRIAVGAVDAASTGENTLVIAPALSAQVNDARSLTLRSFDGLDLYGTAALGGAALQSLTVDTGTVRLVGNQARPTIEAGRVLLTNTSGATNEALAGAGELIVKANSGADRIGQILIGPGSVAVSGASAVTLDAARDVRVVGSSTLSTAGDLSVDAGAILADQGASATLTAGGRFVNRAGAKPAPDDAGLGGHLTIDAGSIEQAGRILLPSGELVLQARGPAGSVHFATGSTTELSGRARVFDSVTIATAGGDLRASSASGNVVIDTGALVDVSAAQAAGRAGSVTILAPRGSVTLDGELRATAATGQQGGSLSIDSGRAVDLARLAAVTNAGGGSFDESISVRNRTGDQALTSEGGGLQAHHVSISSDAGNLSVAGRLDASGASGASIDLSAGLTLSLEAGAELSARGTGSTGGEVRLSAGTADRQADGSFTSHGQIALNGGRIDVRAADAKGVDGSVLLRAQRDVAGTDVHVGKAAGAAGTTLAGATRVEVEAVKDYAASEIDADLIGTINADTDRLGANASAVRGRVGALLGQAVELRAGVEVVSDGDLHVSGKPEDGGWNLTRFAADGTALEPSTGAPVNLTLRAAGNLNVVASISDGFVPAGAAPASAEEASVIAAKALVLPGEGARIRLVGGADLKASYVMQTAADTGAGDVVIGSGSGVDVLVRTTTGSIQIASARDTVLLDRGAAVYTTGRPVDVASLDGYVGNRLSPRAYLSRDGQRQSPILSGGGAVHIDAGRDIAGASDSAPQYGSDWLWRANDLISDGQPMWWSRYDQFRQGFASFGGGEVIARAGRDALNVEVSTATSGYVARNADGSVGSAHVFGGGDVLLQARRDIVGGFTLAAQGTQEVRAGRDITAAADVPALQVIYGDTRTQVSARNGVDLGVAASFGLIAPTQQFGPSPAQYFIGGLTPDASLQVRADAGDLNYRSLATTSGYETANVHLAGGYGQDQVVPDRTSFEAPFGSLSLGDIVQASAGSSRLDLLARNDVKTAGVAVTGTLAGQARPSVFDLEDLTVFTTGGTPLDRGDREPVRIVAEEGDALIGGTSVVRPIRIIAGRDIRLAGSKTGVSMELQHQDTSELSLLQAGRDIVLPDSGVSSADMKLYGAGDLVLVAGRDIALGTSGGVGAIGNRENAALAAGSARITMLAGVSLGAGDYAQAQAWHFPLLGGTGIADHAADLFAQLQAARLGAALPPIGSRDAAAFQALPLDQQIDRTRTLVGQAAFDAALLAAVRRRDGDASITLAAAGKRFESFSASDKAGVVAAALASGWSATLPASVQITQALALAEAAGSGPAYTTALVSFVQAQTAQPGLSPAQALAAFQTLAPERRLLFTNQVLMNEVRQAGRAASLLSGAARDAAYAKAYATLDLVFPEVGSAGGIDMGSSQVRSFQGSDISMLAPRGGINVGDLVAGPFAKKAADLGIVTADGGNVSLIVRNDVEVNQSRVFTVGKGDLLMWASEGNLDAGRGAKTVTGAPPPVFRFDDQGNFVIDTSGSFSGSGIAVLDASSTLDLYAPKGEINAGDAGIKSVGNAFFGAARFVGADNLSIGGVSVGAPPPAVSGGDTAGLASIGQSATSAGTRISADDSEEEKERKRRKRLNLILDFLGFGDGSGKS